MKLPPTLPSLVLPFLLPVLLAIFSCGERDQVLFDNEDAEVIRLSLYLRAFDQSKEIPGLRKTIDTIAPGDSLFLSANIFPQSYFASKFFWTLEGGVEKVERTARYAWKKFGIYHPVFTAIDRRGDTLRDSLTVYVNTAPRITSLLAPADSAENIDPNATVGIKFLWSVDDPDKGDSLRWWLQWQGDFDSLISLDSGRSFSGKISTTLAAGKLPTLNKISWRILVEDDLGKRDTSETLLFTTRDNNSTDGIAQLSSSPEFSTPILKVCTLENPLKQLLPDSSYTSSSNRKLSPGEYRVWCLYPSLPDFFSDTVIGSVRSGAFTDFQIRLRDTLSPRILDTLLPGGNGETVLQRRPELVLQYEEGGGDLHLDDFSFRLNGIDLQHELQLDTNTISWKVQQDLSDGFYNLELSIRDESGNTVEIFHNFSLHAFWVELPGDTMAATSGKSVLVKAKILNPMGSLTYLWDFNADGIWDDSSGLLEMSFAPSFGSGAQVIFGAHDASGNTVKDSTTLIFAHEISPLAFAVDTFFVNLQDSLRWSQVSSPLASEKILYRVSTIRANDTLQVSSDSLENPGIAGIDLRFRGKLDTLTLLVEAFNTWGSPIVSATRPVLLQDAASLLHSWVELTPGSWIDASDSNASLTRRPRVSHTEILQADFEKLMGYNPSTFRGDSIPVHNVSWFESIQYANALGNSLGIDTLYSWDELNDSSAKNIVCDWNKHGFRLPTYDEWEFAARRNDGRNIPTFSASLSCGTANYLDCGLLRPVQAGGYEAFDSYLKDMAGNLSEWVWDWYTILPPPNTRSDYRWEELNAAGQHRVQGGSWKETAGQQVSGSPDKAEWPWIKRDDLGFRLILQEAYP